MHSVAAGAPARHAAAGPHAPVCMRCAAVAQLLFMLWVATWVGLRHVLLLLLRSWGLRCALLSPPSCGCAAPRQVREHETGSHSVLLVNTVDRPGLLTGAGRGWGVAPVALQGLAPGLRAAGAVIRDARAAAREAAGGSGVSCHAAWLRRGSNGVPSRPCHPTPSRPLPFSPCPPTPPPRHCARAEGHQPQRGERGGGHHRPQRIRPLQHHVSGALSAGRAGQGKQRGTGVLRGEGVLRPLCEGGADAHALPAAALPLLHLAAPRPPPLTATTASRWRSQWRSWR